MPIVFAIVAITIMIFIFGNSGKNLITGLIAIIGAFLIGAVGLALLGTGIGIPVFGVAIIIFLILKGASSK
ncbi:hypothetical protein [Aeromonas caviae]|uniref:hypothetical protein n=1 Tax=Aeromonas caviae TaxID=648 RepID=UPI002B48E58A|nr:hypothetical protein [Aeromonas caviae]